MRATLETLRQPATAAMPDAPSEGQAGARMTASSTEKVWRSTSDMLRELRAAYPDSPLSVRVRALAAMQGR